MQGKFLTIEDAKILANEKKIHEECWNLNHSFIIWLNRRLKIYKEDANKMVKLDFHKFEFKDKQYSQLELIDMLIELTENSEDWFDNFDECWDRVNDILDIFKLIFWALWW